MRLQFYPVALHSPFFPVYALAWLKPSGECKGKCRKLIQQGHSWRALPPVQLADQSLSEAILLQAAPRTHIWKDYTMHLRVLFSVIFGSEKKKLEGRIWCSWELLVLNRSHHSILSLNFSYSSNLQKCAHFILEFYIKDLKASFFQWTWAYH